MVLALLPAFQLAGGQADWESGDQDELSADVTALADAVGLGGAVERERLHLDHEVVLGQQSGDLRQRLHGPAVRAATGHPGPGLAGGEVGDGQYLGWPGYQADQLLDRVLPATSNTALTRPPAAARTRAATPSPYSTGIALISRR